MSTCYWMNCCNHEKHSFDSGSCLLIDALGSNRFRRKFFADVCRLKVLRFPEDDDYTRVWKYYLTEGPCQQLQCLQMYYLHFPLNLANLRHFSCYSLTVEVLKSIISNSPRLTHLAIDVVPKSQSYRIVRHRYRYPENFTNVLSRLPLGLQYLKIRGNESDVSAVLSSPAMTTIRCLYFDQIQPSELYFSDHLKFRTAPQLETFGINGTFSEAGGTIYKNTLIDCLKTAVNLKRVELDSNWLTVADKIHLLSCWSGMTIINLGYMQNKTGHDQLLDMILANNRETLDTFETDNCSFGRDSWEKLGNFTRLRRLTHCDVSET